MGSRQQDRTHKGQQSCKTLKAQHKTRKEPLVSVDAATVSW